MKRLPPEPVGYGWVRTTVLIDHGDHYAGRRFCGHCCKWAVATKWAGPACQPCARKEVPAIPFYGCSIVEMRKDYPK